MKLYFTPPSSRSCYVGESIHFTELPAGTNVCVQVGTEKSEWTESTGGFSVSYATAANIKVKLKAKGYKVLTYSLEVLEPLPVGLGRAHAPFIAGPVVPPT